MRRGVAGRRPAEGVAQDAAGGWSAGGGFPLLTYKAGIKNEFCKTA
jgi:hypothetical protein